MIGKQLRKEKLKAGFVFKLVDSIRDMPIPSLPKPRPIRWAPIPISIGVALLIGIIGYGISSGRDVSPDMPILKPAEATFEVSLLSEPDGQADPDTTSDMGVLDIESEDTYQNDLALADAGIATQTQPTAGTKTSGMVVRRVWENAGAAIEASPDGRYVSYINWNKGNLGVYDLETGESRDFTDEGNGETWDAVSAWSPDSRQIAYVSSEGLCLVGIEGGTPRVLCSKSPESGWLCPQEWSRDGRHILAFNCKEKVKGKPHDHDFVLISVADGSIRVLGSIHVLESLHSLEHSMSLSPDGRYMVYHHAQSEDSLEKYDISLLATDGGHEMTLVEHPADDFAPFWTPDGNQIVFASDRSGSMGIWVLEVVDGKPEGSPRLISDNLNGMTPLGLTQDGSYYYKLPGRADDIYFADLDQETGKVVKPPYKAVQIFEGLNSLPHLSPDGKRLVYMSYRGTGGWRSKHFIIRSLETGEERELQTDLPLSILARSEPRWSPDGRSILILATATDSAKEMRVGFHQINVETGAVTHVVWDDGQSRIFRPTPPVWSPDGRKIFFFRQGGGLRTYDLGAAQERKLDLQWPERGRFYAAGLALSPDGRQLACISVFDDGTSFLIAPTTGGEMHEVFRLAKAEILPYPDGMWLVWTPDGRHLLFARRRDEAIELWRISIDGGEAQNLGLAMKKMDHLSVHPDGRRIVFTGPGPRPGNEVWAMENILPTSTASR